MPKTKRARLSLKEIENLELIGTGGNRLVYADKKNNRIYKLSIDEGRKSMGQAEDEIEDLRLNSVFKIHLGGKYKQYASFEVYSIQDREITEGPLIDGEPLKKKMDLKILFWGKTPEKPHSDPNKRYIEVKIENKKIMYRYKINQRNPNKAPKFQEGSITLDQFISNINSMEFVNNTKKETHRKLVCEYFEKEGSIRKGNPTKKLFKIMVPLSNLLRTRGDCEQGDFVPLETLKQLEREGFKVNDCKPGNFIRTKEGDVIPIDGKHIGRVPRSKNEQAPDSTRSEDSKKFKFFNTDEDNKNEKSNQDDYDMHGGKFVKR